MFKTPGDVFLVKLEFNDSRGEVTTPDALTQLTFPPKGLSFYNQSLRDLGVQETQTSYAP